MSAETKTPEVAILEVDGKRIELPVRRDSFGAAAVDITGMFPRHGIMTMDPGFTSTASCRSEITYIDGDKGVLLYRGYPIEQLAAKSSFLETSYLLLKGELPNKTELADFERKVVDRMQVNDQLRIILERRRRTAHPMSLLKGLVTDLDTFTNDYDLSTPEGRENVVIDLVAKMPTAVAMAHRYSAGLPAVYPRKNMSFTENFLRMCFTESDAAPYEVNPVVAKAMDRIFVLHADHEQNASTSTVRLAGSTGTGPYAAITAGIAALWGPAHGGANEAVLNMLEKIGTVENIPAFIAETKQKSGSEKLMGFGHRVYKNFDPRAKIIKGDCEEVLKELGVSDPRLAVAKELEKAALADPYYVEKRLYPNVDFYSGVILSAVGLPTSMFTPIFALARTVGWATQWKELVEDQAQKIGRPRQVYVGEKPRDYIGIEERSAPLTASRDAAAATITGRSAESALPAARS
jgi:citrate synthase